MTYLEEELKYLGEIVAKINRATGWYDTPHTPVEDASLIHSEASEMLEEIRKERWVTQFEGADNKPVGVASECADVLIRLIDFCYRYNINLGKEVETKLEFNRSRAHRHGGKVL